MTTPSRTPSSTALATTIAVGVAIATIRVGAAEPCLTAPEGETPAGQHWFYRIEADTKRHCWYLGDEGKRSSRAPASTSVEPAAPASATSPQMPERSGAEAGAEWQTPQTLPKDEKDQAVPSERQTPAPASSEQGVPGSASIAPPDRWSDVTWTPQPNGVTPSAALPPTPRPMEPTNATNTDATETAVTSLAGTPAEPETSAIGTIAFLIGLTLILLGALILLGLSGRAIYRLAEQRARRPSYRSFGREPTDEAPHATPSQLEVDDNLRRMRELLARLGHEPSPNGEDAAARLRSRQ